LELASKAPAAEVVASSSLRRAAAQSEGETDHQRNEKGYT
jgi:hypothetical protein